MPSLATWSLRPALGVWYSIKGFAPQASRFVILCFVQTNFESRLEDSSLDSSLDIDTSTVVHVKKRMFWI